MVGALLPPHRSQENKLQEGRHRRSLGVELAGDDVDVLVQEGHLGFRTKRYMGGKSL